MTPLRQRMVEEMTMRNYSPKSIKLYVDNVARFARHFGKSPDVLGAEHVRQYLLYLIEDKKMAWGSYNQALAALRYFYRWVLKCEEVVHDVRMPRREHLLPTVLSLDETQRFMKAVVSFKYRMALMTAYSAGLRISERVYLLVAVAEARGTRGLLRRCRGRGRSKCGVRAMRCCRPPCRPFPGAMRSARFRATSGRFRYRSVGEVDGGMPTEGARTGEPPRRYPQPLEGTYVR